jgi:hypothetical protein
MTMTTLKFVWRAIGALPSKATEMEMRQFARAQAEALEGAKIAAKDSLALNVPKRGGKLRDSVKFYGKADGWRVNLNAEYAAIQDAGGLIMPVKGKYLRIPLPEGRRAPRGERGDFVMKTARGKLVVANRTASGRPAIIAVLKKSVRVPATGFIKKAADAAELAYRRIFDRIMEAARGNTK